jgi:hypothetical protein
MALLQFAVIKNDKYHSDMQEVEVLPDSWHPLPLIED